MKTLLALVCMCLCACTYERKDFTKHSAWINDSLYGDNRHVVEITVHCHHSNNNDCNTYLKQNCMNPTVLSTDEDDTGEIILRASCLD